MQQLPSNINCLSQLIRLLVFTVNAVIVMKFEIRYFESYSLEIIVSCDKWTLRGRTCIRNVGVGK